MCSHNFFLTETSEVQIEAQLGNRNIDLIEIHSDLEGEN